MSHRIIRESNNNNSLNAVDKSTLPNDTIMGNSPSSSPQMGNTHQRPSGLKEERPLMAISHSHSAMVDSLPEPITKFSSDVADDRTIDGGQFTRTESPTDGHLSDRSPSSSKASTKNVPNYLKPTRTSTVKSKVEKEKTASVQSKVTIKSGLKTSLSPEEDGKVSPSTSRKEQSTGRFSTFRGPRSAPANQASTPLTSSSKTQAKTLGRAKGSVVAASVSPPAPGHKRSSSASRRDTFDHPLLSPHAIPMDTFSTKDGISVYLSPSSEMFPSASSLGNPDFDDVHTQYQNQMLSPTQRRSSQMDKSFSAGASPFSTISPDDLRRSPLEFSEDDGLQHHSAPTSPKFPRRYDEHQNTRTTSSQSREVNHLKLELKRMDLARRIAQETTEALRVELAHKEISITELTETCTRLNEETIRSRKHTRQLESQIVKICAMNTITSISKSNTGDPATEESSEDPVKLTAGINLEVQVLQREKDYYTLKGRYVDILGDLNIKFKTLREELEQAETERNQNKDALDLLRTEYSTLATTTSQKIETLSDHLHQLQTLLHQKELFSTDQQLAKIEADFALRQEQLNFEDGNGDHREEDESDKPMRIKSIDSNRNP